MKKPVHILTIDTTNNAFLTVSLQTQDLTFIKKEDTGVSRAQTLLPLCLSLLSEHHMVWQDLTDIRVENHEGSLTGLRVGFAVANSLGFLLGVPVNGMPAIQNVHPQYGHSSYLDKPLKNRD